MNAHLIPCLKLTLLTMLMLGVGYPLLITGIAKLTTPGGGEGFTLVENGRTAGFEVIGQSFKSDKYFNGRPSAVSYNAAATGGSNKGPSNPDYLSQVEERIADFLKQNPGVKREEIPVDLITASGGGLDPHISSQAAMIQIPRIAKLRGIAESALRTLVIENTEQPLLGLLGPAQRVNVLKINLALDKIANP